MVWRSGAQAIQSYRAVATSIVCGCYMDGSRRKVGRRHQMLNFRLMMVGLLMEILVLTMEMR